MSAEERLSTPVTSFGRETTPPVCDVEISLGRESSSSGSGEYIVPPWGKIIPHGIDIVSPRGGIVPPGGDMVSPVVGIVPLGGDIVPPGGDIVTDTSSPGAGDKLFIKLLARGTTAPTLHDGAREQRWKNLYNRLT